MRNNRIYHKFKDQVTAQTLNAQQVRALEPDQVKQMVGTDSSRLTENFIKNMKAVAFEQLRDQDDLATLRTVAEMLKQQFPNLNINMHREFSGRIMTIYLDGSRESDNG